MYNFRIWNRNGLYINILEAKSDDTQDIQVSVMANKYDSANPTMLLQDFRDEYLESQGYRKIGAINGGLFFPQGEAVFTVGIEKAFGILNEFDDASKDKVMTLYHDDKMLYVAPQLWVKNNINKYRGAVTAAFGLLNNGRVDISGAIENSAQYNTRSGRAIIGKKSDGTMVMAAFKGVTGSSGLTGPETVKVAQELGLTNAVCMDGGGSVCMMFEEMLKISTSRKLKTAIAFYAKDKVPALKVGDKVTVEGTFTIGNIVSTKAYITELGASIDTKYLKKV